MKDIPLKYDDDDLLPEEWNSIITEMKNFVTSSDTDLSADDNYQIAKAIASYAMMADFYIDSGTVNNYILSTSNRFKSPTEYKNGMRVRFQVLNTNTGASTINVAGLGVKPIKKYGGFDLLANEFKSKDYIELIYNSALGYFIPLRSQKLSIGCACQLVYLDLGNYFNRTYNTTFDAKYTYNSGGKVTDLNLSITPKYNQSYLIAELISSLYIPSNTPSQNLYYAGGIVAMYVNPTETSFPIAQNYVAFERGNETSAIRTPSISSPFTLKGVYNNYDTTIKNFKINIGQIQPTAMYPPTIIIGAYMKKTNTIFKITEIKI